MDPKQAHIRLVLIAGILALAFFVFFSEAQESAPQEEVAEVETIIALKVGTSTFSTLIADTPDKQRQGLSGRPSLEQDQGMLFLFDRSLVRSFWMKEMNFPIDIIWIDENKRITGYKQNALPESFPETFGSEVPVQYVFEVNAFETSRRGIELGDVVEFVYE